MQKASWDSINYAKLSVQMAETLIPSFITLLKGILADFCVPYCIKVSDAGGVVEQLPLFTFRAIGIEEVRSISHQK